MAGALGRALRIVGWALAGLLLALLIYLGAAIASVLFLLDGRSQTVPLSSDLLVCADNVHADFVLPGRLAAEAWPELFPWAELQEKHPQLVVFVGWGDVVFFLDVSEWADVRPGIVVRSLLGRNHTSVRFVLGNVPIESDDCIALPIDKEGEQALINHVTASFDLTADGNLADAALPGKHERYVLAKGRYNPFNTCNQWVANGLGAAGLPHAQFAPFAFSVMEPLRR